MASYKRPATAALTVAGGLVTHNAAAHSPISGIEGFYTGLFHPLSTPGQVLSLLALGIMLGLRWPRWFQASLLAFSATMLLGICLGQFDLMPGWEEPALLLLAVFVATLSALHPAGLLVLFIILSSISGLLIGLLSMPEPGSLRATVITLAGSFVGASLALLYVSGGIGWFQKQFKRWGRIGLRIVAAWIAAISVLLASLMLATPLNSGP